MCKLRLFDVLTDCQTAPYPEAAKSVTLLVRRLAESQGGHELLLGQRGVIALLRMLDSQPNCPQVLTNSCEACRAIITRSVHGHLERLEAQALRTITSKSIHSLDQAPRSAGVNVAWSAACASLVAHFRYDCGSSLRFPKLLGDRQQQSHYLEDAKAATPNPAAAEQSAVLFMLRCLAAILGGKSKWLGARHTHALQVISSMAMLPRCAFSTAASAVLMLVGAGTGCCSSRRVCLGG